jgi:hypothetical protein
MVMFLSHEELSNYITKISSGKDYIYIEDRNTFVVIQYPTNNIKQQATLIYEAAYEDALKEGLLPLKDFEKLLEERGIFTKEDTDNLAKLRGKLEAQQVLLSKTVKVKANQTRIKNVIYQLQDEINDLVYKKHSKLMMSAESKAEEVMNQYMCWASLYDMSNNLLWPTYQEYMQAPPSDVKNQALSSFIYLLNGLNTDIIRFIARSTLWRIRYNTSMKTSEVLFGRPVAEYTTDQLNLVYWSNFYDSIYNMMPDQRPSDDVIEDDDLLDKFMEEYYKELSNEASIARSTRAKNKGPMSAFDAEEVIITQSNELYQEIQYDKPREAQMIKDRADIKKRTVSKRR